MADLTKMDSREKILWAKNNWDDVKLAIMQCNNWGHVEIDAKGDVCWTNDADGASGWRNMTDDQVDHLFVWADEQ